MALSRPGVGIAAGLSIVLLLALSGCGTPVTEEGADRTTTASPRPSPDATPTPTDDGGGDDGKGDADGGEDPAQSRVRTGPVAQYGGPAYGDQGVAEIIQAGLWCKTIKVFRGGGVPEGAKWVGPPAPATASLPRPHLRGSPAHADTITEVRPLSSVGRAQPW